jgi:hypothetical protein
VVRRATCSAACAQTQGAASILLLLRFLLGFRVKQERQLPSCRRLLGVTRNRRQHKAITLPEPGAPLSQTISRGAAKSMPRLSLKRRQQESKTSWDSMRTCPDDAADTSGSQDGSGSSPCRPLLLLALALALLAGLLLKASCAAAACDCERGAALLCCCCCSRDVNTPSTLPLSACS